MWIDYHQPPRSEDRIFFCPASIPGIWALAQEVEEVARIKALGGLLACFGGHVFALPEALVNLYEAVEATVERLGAEVGATRVAVEKRLLENGGRP